MLRIANKNKGLLIVLSGPSGVGKDSIFRKISSMGTNLKLSVSCTTRPPRKGESHGKDYHFITKSEFLDMADKGHFLEYASYCENYYGTPLIEVEENLAKGTNIILIIEVKGAAEVIKKRPDAVSIFILPPSIDVLLSRLKGRSLDSSEVIEKRILEAKKEIRQAKNYKYTLVNHFIEEAAENVLKIIDVECMKTPKMNKIINEVLEND